MISGKVLLNFFVQKEIKNHERNYSRVFFSRPNKEYLLAFYLHFFIHVNDKKNKAKKSFFFRLNFRHSVKYISIFLIKICTPLSFSEITGTPPEI